MTEGYVKILSSILRSSIWKEPDDVRLVWITMLAMADRDGYVASTADGIAHETRTVSEERVEWCLAKFMAPDPKSRSEEFEGRRVQKVDRGWLILNYKKFRDMHGEESKKAAKRRWWEENKKQRNIPAEEEKEQEKVLDSSSEISSHGSVVGSDFDSGREREQNERPEHQPTEQVASNQHRSKPKRDSIDLPLNIRAQEAALTGTQPGLRADVKQLHSAWKGALGIATVLRGGCSQDAFHLADAIDAHGMANCLMVAKYAPLDGMVNGTADKNKQRHPTIAYIFGNENTFSRILTDAQKKEPAPGAPSQVEKLSNAYNQGRF